MLAKLAAVEAGDVRSLRFVMDRPRCASNTRPPGEAREAGPPENTEEDDAAVTGTSKAGAPRRKFPASTQFTGQYREPR